MNALKTTILLSVLTVLLILAGEYLGGSNGAIIAFVIAAATNFFSYFFSDKIALAMYSAKPVRAKNCRALMKWWNGSPAARAFPCRRCM